MVNYNGKQYEDEDNFLNNKNRGLRYGDALFETIRVVNGKIYFWEEHYLRLMSSMRIIRMEIPMNFTMEFLSDEILKTINKNKLENSPARIRLTVFRNDGGFYTPTSNNVSFIIETAELSAPFYTINEKPYEIELFKDFHINTGLLSTLKTNNRLINTVGSIYAKENGYANCVLLNHEKKVVEMLNGNIFIVKGDKIKTPPLSDGCINGILRKKIIEIVNKTNDLELNEESISPFDLQKADELFLTNAVIGIQPITKYRKKQYESTISNVLLGKLNAVARFN